MDEFDRLYVYALGGGGVMNVIVGAVTQYFGPPLGIGPPINYFLGGFLIGMLVMYYSTGWNRYEDDELEYEEPY